MSAQFTILELHLLLFSILENIFSIAMILNNKYFSNEHDQTQIFFAIFLYVHLLSKTFTNIVVFGKSTIIFSIMYLYPSNFCSIDYQTYTQMLEQIKNLKQRNSQLEQALNECTRKLLILNRQNETLKQRQPELKMNYLKSEQEPCSDQIILKKKTRKRKRNDNIDNIFDCPYKNCMKAYGTSLALNLHIKLKHNGGSKKQRQKTAKKIIEAQQRGDEIPQYSIDFPPNYLQNYKKLLASKRDF